MPYTTNASIFSQEPEARIIQLTDDTGTGVVYQPYIDEAIAKADALIDTYLTGHVVGWVISPTPSIIVDISTTLTIFNLYLRRFGAGSVSSDQGISDGLIWRYNDAIKMLEKIAGGTIVINQTVTPVKIYSAIKTQTFTDEFLEGY